MTLVVATACASLAPISPAMRQTVLLLLWAPVVEELVFRWGLQDVLMRTWPRHSALVTMGMAMLFALAHAASRHPQWLPLYLVPGLVLAAAYTMRRSLLLCVALHACMNAAYMACID